MNIWNPVETHKAEQAYEQNVKALGEAPELIRVDGTMTSHEFDDQGNPIDRRATAETRYDVEPGTGLLSDLNSPANWLKYATELTKTAGGTPIGGAILNQMNSGAIAINKARADNEILKGNIQMIERDIMGTAHDNEQPIGQPQQPQQAMNPLAQQVTQNVQATPTAQPNMPVSPNVAPVAPTSQNLGTSVPPQVSPVRGDSRALPQPAPAQTLDDKVAEYTQKRRALEGKLLWTGMPGGAGAKAAIESRLKALDVEYGMGPETTSFIQNYNQARERGYKGSMEEWKKAGAVNLTPPMPQMLTDPQKVQLGLIGPDGKATKEPWYLTGKGDLKKAEVKGTDVSERQSAAYASMMENLEPQLRELAPENGYDMNLIRQEASEMLSWLPMNMANMIQTGKGQKRKAAQDAWLNANGRDESGATIKDEEMDKYRQYYFTTAFDKAETIAFKSKLREQAVNGMKMKSGKAGGVAQNAFLSEYQLRASANKMVYTHHDNTHIYGTDEYGRKQRITIGE